jgi:hypothetical protein
LWRWSIGFAAKPFVVIGRLATTHAQFGRPAQSTATQFVSSRADDDDHSICDSVNLPWYSIKMGLRHFGGQL